MSEGGAAKKPVVSLTARAGCTLPVSRCTRALRLGWDGRRVTENATIAMTVILDKVLEALLVEIGANAKGQKVTVSDVNGALRRSKDLRNCVGDVHVMQAAFGRTAYFGVGKLHGPPVK